MCVEIGKEVQKQMTFKTCWTKYITQNKLNVFLENKHLFIFDLKKLSNQILHLNQVVKVPLHKCYKKKNSLKIPKQYINEGQGQTIQCPK